MGMVVRTNTMAMNANRQLGMNNSQVAKSLEKLSSGFKINRAADDASGLAISEKMKAQIKGLETASANSQDGISLIQTAEGGAQEIHDMLNRMVELATKSANGTIQDEVDREAIQREVDDLNSEITRIAKSTNFNGIDLLNGHLSVKTTGVTDGTATTTTTDGVETLANAFKDKAAAAKGAYEYQFKSDTGVIKGATGVPGYAFDIDVKLSDDSVIKTRVILDGATTAANVTKAVDAALKANSDLAKLFDVTATGTNADAANAIKLSFTSKTDGTAGMGVKSISINALKADTSNGGAFVNADGTDVFTKDVEVTDAGVTTKTAASDAYDRLTITDAGSNTVVAPTSGMKVTVGDNTFEFRAADDYDIESGNVRVVLGKDTRESLKNLVAALHLKGVDSASLTTDNHIRIDDLDQLKTSSKTNSFVNKLDFSSESAGLSFGNATAVNGVYKTDAVNVAAQLANKSITLSYTGTDGRAMTHTISGISSSSASVAANAQAVADAINNDAKMKELFTASVESSKLVLTAKDDKNGAKITNMTTGASGDLWTGVTTSNIAETTTAAGQGQTVSFTMANLNSGDTMTVNGKEYQFLSSTDSLDPGKVKDGASVVVIGADAEATAKNLRIAMSNNGISSKVIGSGNNAKLLFEEDGEVQAATGGLTLQIGDTGDDFNKVTVSVDDLSATGIGTAGLDVSSQAASNKAIDTIKAAINQVSTNRANLGSLQNRLEHTINNLDTTAENMTAANSRIRDTDMAKEMMNYTKMNVLTQAAQAMLAQANQQPQSILQLLQ